MSADRHAEYANTVEQRLRDAGIRAIVDGSSERMNAKIRNAQLQKIPYMLVIGDREIEADAVAVRLRTEEDLGAKPGDGGVTMIRRAIDEKSIDLT